ncbi:MAG: FAD-dependent oxidoreductase, partial [Planctomycetota bacterium]
MPLRVSNIRLRWDEPETELPARLARILGLRAEDLASWRILRKSLDARDKGALQFVYAAEVSLPDAEAFLARRADRRAWKDTPVDLYQEPPFILPEPGEEPLPHRPVIV